MKKIRIALLTVAIILAIGGAYAGSHWIGDQSWRNAVSTTEAKADPTRDLTLLEQKACDCTEFWQYYRRNSNDYVEAGEFGFDYDCLTTVGVCTYYKPFPDSHPNFYSPCRNGAYWPGY